MQSNRRRCFNCGKTGHINRDCKKPKKDKYTTEKKKGDNKSSEEYIFSVICNNEVETEIQEEDCTNSMISLNKIVWILDSGCSRNITGNLSLFGEDTEAAERRAVMPDGTRAKSSEKAISHDD
jgi:hypothetical protein